MAIPVTSTASLWCSFGTAASTYNVLPTAQVTIEGQNAGSINDYISNTNIPPFGMCSSLSNPAVASATSAASGVLTPQACVPALAAAWVPGSPTVMIGDKVALSNASTCACSYGGVITVMKPGPDSTTVA